MLNILTGLAVAIIAGNVFKDYKNSRHSLSAEHWNNQSLLHEDTLNPNISGEQILKNDRKGKYFNTQIIPVDTSSHIVINENETDMLSYYSALDKHGRWYAEMMYKAGAFRMKEDSYT